MFKSNIQKKINVDNHEYELERPEMEIIVNGFDLIINLFGESIVASIVSLYEMYMKKGNEVLKSEVSEEKLKDILMQSIKQKNRKFTFNLFDFFLNKTFIKDFDIDKTMKDKGFLHCGKILIVVIQFHYLNFL